MMIACAYEVKIHKLTNFYKFVFIIQKNAMHFVRVFVVIILLFIFISVYMCIEGHIGNKLDVYHVLLKLLLLVVVVVVVVVAVVVSIHFIFSFPVTWGLNPFSSFQDMPRTRAAALSSGWDSPSLGECSGKKLNRFLCFFFI
jgi:hypothetical protein